MDESDPVAEEPRSPATLLSRIRALLGFSPDQGDPRFAAPSLEALLRRTRRQLLVCARDLGLTGIARLRKNELATRFQAALERVAALAGAGEGAVAHPPHRLEPRAP